MTRTIVIEPPAPLLTPDLVRERLAVSDRVTDDTLAAYIAAATADLDCPGGWLGRALGAQTLEARLDAFPGHCRRGFEHDDPLRDRHRHRLALTLQFPPIVSIVGVTYRDACGEAQTVDPSTYVFDGDRTITPVVGGAWPPTIPASEAVRIRYEAGYAEGQLPVAIGQAIVIGVSLILSMTRPDILLKQDTVVGVSSTVWETAAIAVVLAALEKVVGNLVQPYRVYQ